ncbi:filamin-A-like isoform X1 [Mytilus californianus]|uniref:filamin-A-like isoform X1 n=1 Tax=Mytilus californianus TaxID=6549 RepID=UPI0022478E6D|nr:filamin-A-like isoform X1 [Mytilus californianus]
MSARALSREGHAAMSLRGETDRWVLIQQNTFANWVNEQLRIYNCDLIEDLQTDFSDGVRLCYLVEALQGKKIGRIIKKPTNHHQNLENVSKALNAIANDNVRLVNIGSDDIVTGNLKLILGLIWHLILRYQIGKTKFPTKKLMLAWIQAVIPECGISNFTTDWNDGIALNALVDFCRPGLAPDWRHMSRSSGLDNCRIAMQLAKDNFDIPLVVRPEDLASPDLDELSGMTYLSYFMKIDSPGYFATLKIIQSLLKYGTCNNFASDWQDGHLLANLVKSLGENVPNLTGSNSENIQKGLEAAQRLGVNPILTAKEMCDPEVDHIGIMAYAAYFKDFKPTKTPAERVVLSSPPKNVYVGLESNFSVRIEDDNVSPSDVRAEIKGPDSSPNVRLSWTGSIGDGLFTPEETGVHRLSVFCNNQLILGCPVTFKSMADRSRITFTSVDSCPVGMITELKVDSSRAGQGDVRVEAQSPGGRIQNLTAVYRQGQYIVNFSPSEAGVWNLSVLYDGEHISGSPYSVVVYDPASVRVYGLEGGIVGSDLTFHADHSSAGDGDLDVTILYEGSRVPANVSEDSRGVNRINFTPQGAGIYKVHVNFNGTEVKGSPYMVEIFGGGRATVSGDGLSLVPLNKTAYFNVDTQGSPSKVDVEITGPSGQRVNKVVKRKSSGLYQVEYIPTEVGEHKIDVFHGGHPIQSGPFKAKVYSSDGIIVSNVPPVCMYGNPVKFNINAEKAGPGNIEIMINSGTIPCQVQTLNEHEDKYFEASFIPEGPKPHLVEMKFNKKEVIGSPWTVAVIDPKSFYINGDGLYLCHTNKTASFNINNKGEINQSFLHLKISAPSKRTVPYNIRRTKEGHTVEYIPTEVGDHRIEIKYGDSEIEGSPFTAKAYDTHAIRVSRFGDTLVGKSVDFTIDVTSAGEGQLEIMVNNGNLPNTVEMENAGVYKIAFIPEQAGKQYVDINFNREPLPDSPFTCMALDMTGALVRGLKSVLPTDKATSFTIQSEGVGSLESTVDVQIYTENGDKMPSRLSTQIDGTMKVEWTPVMAGQHRVEIYFGGQPIEGSPYYVDVFDVASIRVSRFNQRGVGEPASFDVDLSQASRHDYDIIIKSPSGRTVDHSITTEDRDWIKNIAYIPDESGPYSIYVSYAGYELPGCPYIQNIDDGGLPTASGDGLYSGEENKNASFIVDVGNRIGDLGVKVEGPNSIAKTTLEQREGRYIVSYVPVEVGVFTLVVTWNGKDIPGSPFHPKVVDPHKVVVVGGWQQILDSKDRINLVVGEPKHIAFDISQAGPGHLTSEVTGPTSSLHSVIEATGSGQVTMTFTPEQEGNHYIHLQWSKLALPKSPLLGYAVHGRQDNKVILTGRGLKEASVREEAEFNIDGTQAGPGTPEVTLTGVKAEIPVKVIAVAQGKYRCQYVPVIPGAYLLNITWNNRQLRGSPYKVNVIGAFYPNKVTVSGEGLTGGIAGRSLNVTIDTRKAGPGELTASCMGPNKAAYCELEDNRDGTFELRIKPQEIGRHVLQVKYGGEHVQGSPFIIKVSAPPDASKVRVTGPGVEHGILAKFQSKFIVETKGAGAGQLTVRVRGPKGSFRVEMKRDSQRDRTILCQYYPTEIGDYHISVKWSSVDVPGSPFLVHIVDTMAELEEVMRSSMSGRQPTARSYDEWREKL